MLRKVGEQTLKPQPAMHKETHTLNLHRLPVPLARADVLGFLRHSVPPSIFCLERPNNPKTILRSHNNTTHVSCPVLSYFGAQAHTRRYHAATHTWYAAETPAVTVRTADAPDVNLATDNEQAVDLATDEDPVVDLAVHGSSQPTTRLV